MLNALRLSLILVLALTGLSLGAARGQAKVADQIVLCTGESVVTVAVDDQGKPITRVLICPDMALSLMQGVHDGSALPDTPTRFSLFEAEVAETTATALWSVAARARDPPPSFTS